MTLTKFKKLVEQSPDKFPHKWVFVDQNHTLLLHYLDSLSLIFNRKLVKIFNVEEAVTIPSTDFESDYTIYLLYIPAKDVEKVLSLLPEEIMAIAILFEEIKTQFEQLVLGEISKEACLAFLSNYVATKERIKTKGARDEDKPEDHDEDKHISYSLLEELVDYFENNLDNCINEIKKVEVLGISGSWDRPFKALLDILPPKDQKLHSLKWFSGGDVDTCQVLYNLYMKKLKNLPNANLEDQVTWSKLVQEAIWCEACILSGTIGDYVKDYLRLVELSLPNDFTVEYFPPVFYEEVIKHPEYGIEEVK